MKRPGFAAIFVLFAAGMMIPSFAQSDDTVVVLNTKLGKIAIEFFPEDAPNHVDNFIQLSQDGFYDDTLFHRIIPGFMIQGGDPLTAQGESTMNRWGTGGPEHQVSQEFNDIKHVRGIVSMARSNHPDSAGSQFFIVHADSSHLDGQYTAFGRIITEESLETLDKIALLETTNTKPDDWEKTLVMSADVVPRSELTGILELGEPARSDLGGILELGEPRMGTSTPQSHSYRSDDLGFEFSGPVGWLIQEPSNSQPGVPDVVVIGAGTSSVSPYISITVDPSNGTSLDERMDERRENIRPAVESGQLNVISEEKDQLYGRDAYVINATGTYDIGSEVLDVQFTEIVFLENGRFYAITYTSATSEHEQYLEQYRGVLESLEILGAESGESTAQNPDESEAQSGILDSLTIPGTESTAQNPDESEAQSGILDSLTIPGTESTAQNPDDNGCLIATATYGSEMAPQVQFLREIRDNTVLSTQSGSAFMTGFNQIYYSFSPTVADWERQNPVFKEAVKVAITPMLGTLAVLNQVEAGSESEMLAYGIGVIAANVGIYLIAPAMIIHRIFRR